MKLGLHLNDFDWPVAPDRVGATVSEIAAAAEAAGFDAIAVMDHVWQHPIMGGPEKPVLECYATLSYLAARTARVRLLALATPPSYRVPAMLAKTVTTLDVLSGGRAWLGVGAGDYEEEARGLGIPIRPRPSATNCWRRRFRSACGCGAASEAMTAPSPASTSRWSGRSTCRRVSPGRIRRS